MAITVPVFSGGSWPLRIKSRIKLWRALTWAAVRLGAAVLGQRGSLLPWGAVAFGAGIGLWFEAGRALGGGAWLGLCALVAGGLWGASGRGGAFGLGLAAAGFAAAGALACELRWRAQDAPALERSFYGAVEGRVVEIDASAQDTTRLSLEDLVLEGLDRRATPIRIRISLAAEAQGHSPLLGERVALTARLNPPSSAVEPGGFDFRRSAYFDRLGAVGYSRTPVMLREAAPPDGLWFARLARDWAAVMRAEIAGEAGAFAAGAMTGVRDGISRATLDALRDSSLAHILAISGMNLAVLTGFVFGLLRGGLALWPWGALRLPTKKLAAVAAMGVAWFYLQLSGGNVATERAFIMALVLLGAVLCDRRAVSLRSAGCAALILLARQPEALLEAGFQMSMAATVALIAGFEALSARWRAPRLFWPLAALLASTLLGGLASAPYAAAHFNRFADYGLIANLLTVPIMGVAIMPMGVLAFLLWPLGLGWLPLWVMGRASEWILFVAHLTQGWDGAVSAVPVPPAWGLALLSFGALWWILWQGRARVMGAGLVALILGLWAFAPPTRPDLLLAPEGAVFGLWERATQTRSLSRAKGAGFFVENWLAADGDLAGQAVAAVRGDLSGPSHARVARFHNVTIVALSGKAGAAARATFCAPDVLIFSDQDPLPDIDACAVIGPEILRETGTLAFWREEGVVRVETARQGRLWDGGSPASWQEAQAKLLAALPAGFVLSAR